MRRHLALALAVVLLASAAQQAAAFYSEKGPVVVLTEANLKTKVKPNQLLLTEFYAPCASPRHRIRGFEFMLPRL